MVLFAPCSLRYCIKWVRLCYGDEFLQKIWNEYSTCAGVVFGDVAAITLYLQLFVEEFTKKRLCSKEGSDTAVHVKVITDLMPPVGKVVTINYKHAPILHMGPIPLPLLGMPYHWDDHGRLLNADKRPVRARVGHPCVSKPLYCVYIPRQRLVVRRTQNTPLTRARAGGVGVGGDVCLPNGGVTICLLFVGSARAVHSAGQGPNCVECLAVFFYDWLAWAHDLWWEVLFYYCLGWCVWVILFNGRFCA